MKIIVTKDESTTTYEGVTNLKVVDGSIEFNYINRFRTSPEEEKDLVLQGRIQLPDEGLTRLEFIKD